MLDERLVDRPGAHERRRREGEPVGVRRTRDEAGRALLHDGLGARRAAAASSQAWQVPSVGCPANGSSCAGVKMRTR